MRKLLLILFTAAPLFAYDFEYEPCGIPVEMMNGDIPASPWIGGGVLCGAFG